MNWAAWIDGAPGPSPPSSWASSSRPTGEQGSPGAALAMSGGGINRILVIDHEPDLRNSYDRLLRRQGYRVVTAGSRAEGLRLVTEPPRLVLPDLRLPASHPLQTLRPPP